MTVLLRPVIESDLPTFFEIQREPAACKMVERPARAEADFFHHWRTNILPNPEVRILAIEYDGELVGHIASFVREGRRFLGYWLAQRHWGQGLATAAVREFIATKETTRPLSAFVATGNRASMQVLRKCGFVQRETSARVEDGVAQIRFELV